MRLKAALLLLAVPSFAAAAEPGIFQFAVGPERFFTLTRTTVVLDDDDKGVPHRFASTETMEGTITPAKDGGYSLVLKPVAYAIKIDGYTAADHLTAAYRQSVITVTLDSHGLARSVAGTEALQKFADRDYVGRQLLGRDLDNATRAWWNDRMLLDGKPSANGTSWDTKQRDGTTRVWKIAGPERCASTSCVSVQSRWEADSASLLRSSRDPASKDQSSIREARLSAQTDSLIDPATLLPRHETLRQSQYLAGKLGDRNVERRMTRTVESDYVWRSSGTP